MLNSFIESVSTGIVEPQTANMTKEELSKVEGNQTFSRSTKNRKTLRFLFLAATIYFFLINHLGYKLFTHRFPETLSPLFWLIKVIKENQQTFMFVTRTEAGTSEFQAEKSFYWSFC